MRKTLTQALLAAFCAILARGTSAAHVEGGGVMQIASRVSMWSGARTPTAKDYVQDGLVAMWDGIENAGWGTHADTLSTWRDLTGNGYNMTVNSEATIGANSVGGNNIWVAYYKNATIPFWSASVVGLLPDTGAQRFLFCGSPTAADGKFVYVHPNGSYGRIGLSQRNTQNVNYVAIPYPEGVMGRLAGIHVNYGKGSTFGATDAYVNAIPQTLDTGSYPYNNAGSFFSVGTRLTNTGNPASSFNYGGTVCNIRLYSRALTAEEIARNYNIDKLRFNLP